MMVEMVGLRVFATQIHGDLAQALGPRRLSRRALSDSNPTLSQNQKMALLGPFLILWRRGWDLNPRHGLTP